MEAVVIANAISKQKRGWLGLTRLVTTIQKTFMTFRITNVDAHIAVPTICNGDQMRVNGRPESCDEIGQRIAEILVFAAPEPVPRHDDATAKQCVFRVQRH